MSIVHHRINYSIQSQESTTQHDEIPERDTRISSVSTHRFRNETESLRELDDYLKTSNVCLGRELSLLIFGKMPFSPNKPMRHSSKGLYPLHYAAQIGNQRLVTLLLDSGAYVDQPDQNSQLARDHNPELSFCSTEGLCPRSIGEQKKGWPTQVDIMQLAHAVGSLQVRFRQPPHPLLSTVVHNTIYMKQSSQELLQASWLFRFSAKTLTLPTTPGNHRNLDMRLRRLFSELNRFIPNLAMDMQKYKEHCNDYPDLTDCFRGNYSLILKLWSLEDLYGALELDADDKALILMYAATIINTKSRLIRRLCEGKYEDCLLFLYPALKDDKTYIDILLNKLRAFRTTSDLRIYILLNLHHLYLKSEHLPQDYDKIVADILGFLFKEVRNAPRAVARLLASNRGFRRPLKLYGPRCSTRIKEVVLQNLTSIQYYTIFMSDERKSYFRRLFDHSVHLDNDKIKNDSIFDFAAKAAFESAFLDWLKSRPPEFIQKFIHANFELFTSPGDRPNNEARAVFFSKILMHADTAYLKEHLSYSKLMETHFGRIMLEEVSFFHPSVRLEFEHVFFGEVTGELKNVACQLLNTWINCDPDDPNLNVCWLTFCSLVQQSPYKGNILSWKMELADVCNQ